LTKGFAMSGIEPVSKNGPFWTYEDGSVRIVINRKWCKGCEICVAFCPPETLEMEGDKAVVKDLGSCTKCLLCEMRCPDFAIAVTDLSKPDPKKPADSSGE